MRAALSILGLVIVLAIVMVNVRNSSRQLQAPIPASAASDGAPVTPKAQTDAVRQQVQGLVDRAAQRASEAAAP